MLDVLDFDKMVVGTILEDLKLREDAAIFVTCDHRTPVEKRTHTNEPVPFAYSGKGVKKDNMKAFSESAAESGSVQNIIGHELLNLFIGDFIEL